MHPDSINGLIPADQPMPQPDQTPSPLQHGLIKTADFEIAGNLKLAFHHLKEIFEPQKSSESGPIKPLTAKELEREKQKSKEDFLNDLEPTVSS